MELAELYREQGRFDEAELVIQSLDERDVGVTSNLISSSLSDYFAIHGIIAPCPAKR